MYTGATWLVLLATAVTGDVARNGASPATEADAARSVAPSAGLVSKARDTRRAVRHTAPKTRQVDQLGVGWSGNYMVLPGSYCQFTAGGFGGYPPYQYTWYFDNNQVGTGQVLNAYMPRQNFILRIVVRDSWSNTAQSYAQIYVQSSGVGPCR